MYAEHFDFDVQKRFLPPSQTFRPRPFQIRRGGARLHTLFVFQKNDGKSHFARVKIIDGNLGTVNNLKKQLGENLNDGPGSIAYFLSGKAMDAAWFERFLKYL